MAQAYAPAQFVQNLAINCQVLACVQLLYDFQILSCIPPQDPITCDDLSGIVGLPEAQLRAVVRMTASVGFLSMPRPGLVAHSSLSAQFATDVGIMDAFGFLAETLAPCALRMPDASRRDGCPSPYSLAFGEGAKYATEAQHRWRLQRQAIAHWRFAMGNGADNDEERRTLLASLDWKSLGAVTVIDVDGPSAALAVALTSEHKSISVIVQRDGASFETVPPYLADRIKLEEPDAIGLPAQEASVFILHMASPSITQPLSTVLFDAVAGKFAILLPVLRRDPLARVVLLARILPEVIPSSGAHSNNGNSHDYATSPVSLQSLAFHRNLALHQLAAGRDHERSDVLACVERTKDDQGSLVVTHEIHGKDSVGMMAFEIQYLSSAK